LAAASGGLEGPFPVFFSSVPLFSRHCFFFPPPLFFSVLFVRSLFPSNYPRSFTPFPVQGFLVKWRAFRFYVPSRRLAANVSAKCLLPFDTNQRYMYPTFLQVFFRAISGCFFPMVLPLGAPFLRLRCPEWLIFGFSQDLDHSLPSRFHFLCT